MNTLKYIAIFYLVFISFNMLKSFISHIKHERHLYRKKGVEFETKLVSHSNDNNDNEDNVHLTSTGLSWHWHPTGMPKSECKKKDKYFNHKPHSFYKGSIDENLLTSVKILLYVISVLILISYILLVK